MKIKKGLQRKLRTPAVNDRIMMLFGQIACAAQCPLLGVKRTWRFALHMSAYDQKRTSVSGSSLSPEQVQRLLRITILESIRCFLQSPDGIRPSFRRKLFLIDNQKQSILFLPNDASLHSAIVVQTRPRGRSRPGVEKPLTVMVPVSSARTTSLTSE